MTPLLLALALAAPVPKELKKEAPSLNGTWALSGLEFNGQVLARNRTDIWRFADGTLTIESPNAGPRPVPIKTDPRTSPKEFQFTNNGNQLGVYEVTGDALVICVSQVQGVRPADTAGGNNVIKYVFTRVKDQ